MPDDSQLFSADRVLSPFLEAVDAGASEALLGDLMASHADPVIRSVIRRKLAVSLSSSDGAARNQDALDLAGDITARLVAELRNLKRERETRVIADFKAYVAVTTYNGCHDYLRRLHPRRWQLRNKLRYLLTHRPDFAIWQGQDRDWLCGLSRWGRAGAIVDLGGDERQRRLRDFFDSNSVGNSFAGAPHDRQIESLLAWLGAPIRLDHLVELAAELWQVEDVRVTSDADGDRESLPDPAPDPGAKLDDRTYLERLWAEIGSLPQRQRAALLLNLRDSQGRGVVGLLPLVGIATIRQIASALETPAERFAEQWATLPWDDARIGSHLGVERQQVVNLRKAARARLTRRMRGW